MAARRVASRGALLAIDVALVDRLWKGMPAREAIARVATPAPLDATGAPGAPSPVESTGLDVALRSLAARAALGSPLAEALRQRRATKIPWRWLTSIPTERDELRADERLLRWAEVTRLPDLSPGDVLLVGSAVERTMLGASELAGSFARWKDSAFVDALLALRDDEITDVLLDAWDAPEPLMALAGVDEEAELWSLARERVAAARRMAAFARERSLSLVPWSPEIFPDYLRARAAAR